MSSTATDTRRERGVASGAMVGADLAEVFGGLSPAANPRRARNARRQTCRHQRRSTGGISRRSSVDSPGGESLPDTSGRSSWPPVHDMNGSSQPRGWNARRPGGSRWGTSWTTADRARWRRRRSPWMIRRPSPRRPSSSRRPRRTREGTGIAELRRRGQQRIRRSDGEARIRVRARDDGLAAALAGGRIAAKGMSDEHEGTFHAVVEIPAGRVPPRARREERADHWRRRSRVARNAARDARSSGGTSRSPPLAR